MSPEAIFRELVRAFGEDAVFDLHADPAKDKDPWFCVRPASLVDVAVRLRDDPAFAFDRLECLTGIDDPEEGLVRVVYHLHSHSKRHRAVLKIALDRAAPRAPSLVPVWAAANWQERECFDLLGVVFEGHPDLRRLLLPDDWEGHPLRKDWKEPSHYHGIPTTRPNPIDLFALGTKPKGPEGAA